MLEHTGLWLVPWAQSGQPAPSLPEMGLPLWGVFDAVSHEFLGLARRRPDQGRNWLGLRPYPVIDVLESNDESLLFVLTRTWVLGPSWLIGDADGRRIGTMRGNTARDGAGRLLARLEWSADGATGRWQGADSRFLGVLARENGGVVVTFAPDVVRGNPFVKMVLLATLLRSG